jgi:hypothetical protein
MMRVTEFDGTLRPASDTLQYTQQKRASRLVNAIDMLRDGEESETRRRQLDEALEMLLGKMDDGVATTDLLNRVVTAINVWKQKRTSEASSSKRRWTGKFPPARNPRKSSQKSSLREKLREKQRRRKARQKKTTH